MSDYAYRVRNKVTGEWLMGYLGRIDWGDSHGFLFRDVGEAKGAIVWHLGPLAKEVEIVRFTLTDPEAVG